VALAMSAKIKVLPNPLFDIEYKPKVIQRVFDYYDASGLIKMTEVYAGGGKAFSWLKKAGNCGKLKEKEKKKRARKRRRTLANNGSKPNLINQKGKSCRKK
jgi:hypothetical protein